MRILAFESGGVTAVVGAVYLQQDMAELVAWAPLSQPRALGRELISLLDTVLREAGWKLEEVDLLVTGLGPGSWTSLRVGVTTARTLAQAHNLALVGVPSFDAMAAAAHSARLEKSSQGRTKKSKSKNEAGPQPCFLQILSPCRPGELYGKLFLSHPEYLGIAQAEWIASPERHVDAAFAQMLASDIHGELALCGESAAVDPVAKLLEASSDPCSILEIGPEHLVLELALAGAARFTSGDQDDPLTLVPLYLAPSNAERNLAAGTLKRR